MLKQVVDEPEGVPGETTQAYEGKKRAIGGRGQWLSDIVKKLETVASEKPPLIWSDALDECVAEHWANGGEDNYPFACTEFHSLLALH